MQKIKKVLTNWYLWVICHHFFSPGIKLLLFKYRVGEYTLGVQNYTPFRCTLPHTFTYRALPYSVHCLLTVYIKFKKSGDR